MKIAKLVRVSLVTRVVVDIADSENEDEILGLAIPKLSENLMDSLYESVDEIVDDIECPYILGEEYSIKIGDEVDVPSPTQYDLHNNEFTGTIEYIKEDTDGTLYGGVRDSENNIYDISLSRLTN